MFELPQMTTSGSKILMVLGIRMDKRVTILALAKRADGKARTVTIGNEESFSISLVIRHPEMRPGTLTDALGFSPSRQWGVGEQRQTPKGTILEGEYDHTMWIHTVSFQQDRHFFDRVLDIVANLEKFEDFLEKLVETGGSIRLNIRLPGNLNVGDELQPESLEKLARLHIGLSVEVFPTARC